MNVCSFLLSRRARTTGTGKYGSLDLLQSGLHCAIIGNDARCVQSFLDHGCKVDDRLQLFGSSEGPVSTLISDGVRRFRSLSSRSRYLEMYQPLHLAVMNRNTGIVQCLVAAGATLRYLQLTRPPTQDVSEAQSFLSPLMVAAVCGYPDVLDLLISRGADPNASENKNGVTALICAATYGRANCVGPLVDAGANIDAQAHTSGTALDCAIWNKRTGTALLLLRKNAACDIVTSEGYTALDGAVVCGLEDIAHELARRQAIFRKVSSSSNSYSLIRLLNVNTFEYRTFGIFARGISAPSFATLSHLSGSEETFYDRLKNFYLAERKAQFSSTKLQGFLAECKKHGVEWAWAASLCSIPRDERSDAVRHVFTWHAVAAKHFIFLDDVERDTPGSLLETRPRIFRRS